MRQFLAAAAGLVVLAASACSPPTAPRSDVPSPKPAGPASLPAPTGDHPVGTTVLYPTDTSRADPWNLDVEERELKVTLWYPTERRGGQRARYLSPRESKLVVRRFGVADVPPDTLSTVRTNAVEDAEPAGRQRPLVVLSPGFTKPASSLTSLAEELASHGYVVAGIDHTYENHATTLADGRVARCLACDLDTDPGFGTRVVRGRSADVAFVLDHLISSWDTADQAGTALIDRSRIAMVGQSIGGASVMAAMVRDSRVRAGINLDGTMYARISEEGVSRPFMFIGSRDHTPGNPRDRSWDRDWRLLTGWKRWLVLPRAEHQSFTDNVLLADAVGIRRTPGVLSPERSIALTRTYVTAFLDQHLRGKPRSVLDEPAGNPEVEFCPAHCARS